MDDARTFDYVIVGAGSAGCLLANRLSADRATRVLLLEAGGQDNWIWYHIPVGYLYSNNNPRSDWCYRTEPEPGLGGRSIPYPRGKVVGGSSAINAMIYMRGQAADFDHWRQLGLAGWGWDDVLPHFKAHEDYFGGADDVHGAGGELRVDPPRVAWPVLDAVRRAAIDAGIPAVDDFNRGDNEGVGPLHVNQRRGLRFQAARAFLRPALIRPNLTLETGVVAERIRLKERRAVGVDYLADGTRQSAFARRDVILAAGAIGSPQLLMLSGIGPGAHLAQHGIEVHVDRPGVGAGLHDHLQIPLRYTVEGVATLNERFHSPLQKALMIARFALFRRGPLTHGAVAARHLHALLARRGARRHRLQHRALHAHQHRHAQARRTARRDADRLRLPAHQPRRHPPEVARPARRPGDPSQLSCHRARPPRRRQRHARDAQHHAPAGDAAL